MVIEMIKSKPMKLLAIFSLLFFIFSQTTFAQTSIQTFAPKPLLGWNSFDSYRSNLTADQAFPMIDVMAEKYLPF
jgi:hypothetical protein